MRVFVKNMRGRALMPCSQRKARLLLKQKKAKIVGYRPFTIQLTYATGEAKQEIHVGIDEGARHNAIITYGSITTPKRKELGLEKIHYNDAIAITDSNFVTRVNAFVKDYQHDNLKEYRKDKTDK